MYYCICMLYITKGYLSDFDAILQEDLKLKYIPIHYWQNASHALKASNIFDWMHGQIMFYPTHPIGQKLLHHAFSGPVKSGSPQSVPVQCVVLLVLLWTASTGVLSQAVVQSVLDLRHHRLCHGTFSHVRPVLQVIKCNLGQIIDNYSEHKVNQLANNIKTIENLVNFALFEWK